MAIQILQQRFLTRRYLINTTRFFVNFSAAVEQVFKIGSMEPGAMLFDASKEFEASDFPFCFLLTHKVFFSVQPSY